MKKHCLLYIASLGLSCVGIGSAQDTETTSPAEQECRGMLLDEIDVLSEEYGDDTVPFPNDGLSDLLTKVHKDAAEKMGFRFFVEQAFLYTNGHRLEKNDETSGSSQTWYKLHAQGGVQLFKSERHQGTWVKTELSGSVALNQHTRRITLDDSWGASGPADCDVFAKNYFYLPELLISQGFMKGQMVVMAGMINQTNYIDFNSYANTSFTQFGSAPFVNNQVLPLNDSNFGFMLQYQFNQNYFATLGGNFMDNDPRHNPFRNTTGKAFNLVGELTWVNEKAFGLGAGAYRLQPFLFHADGKTEGGVAINLEQDLGDSPFAIFSRAGWSSAQEGNAAGAVAQASAGLIIKKPIEILTGFREGDANFFGVSFSVSKPNVDSLAENRPTNDREMILECTYSFAVTPYFLIKPAYQMIQNPSGRDDVHTANIFSVQGVITF